MESQVVSFLVRKTFLDSSAAFSLTTEADGDLFYTLLKLKYSLS